MLFSIISRCVTNFYNVTGWWRWRW